MDIVRGEDLAAQFQDLISRAAHDERIIISFAGVQVALVSFDDLAILEELDREQDRQDAEEYRRIKSETTQTPIPFVPATLTQEASKQ